MGMYRKSRLRVVSVSWLEIVKIMNTGMGPILFNYQL